MKKKIIIIIFLLAIIILGFFIYKFYFKKETFRDVIYDMKDTACEMRGEIHKAERLSLYPKLETANSVKECKQISERLNKLGPLECHLIPDDMGGGPLCGCDEAYGYGNLLNECLSSLAVKTNNISLCNDEARRKEICERDKKPGVSDEYFPICEENLNEDCILDYLVKASPSNDLNIDCNAFNPVVSKYFCLERLAIAKNDMNVCLEIDDQVYQDGCIYNFALKNRDFSLCEKIKDENSYRTARDCRDNLGLLSDEKNKPNESSSDMFEFAIIHKDPSLCPQYEEWSESQDNICQALAK